MKSARLLRGTLDLLVLKVIEEKPLSGSDIRREIERLSGGRLKVGSGSWIAARERLEEKHLTVTRGTSLTGRKSILYGLSQAGRREMIERSQHWRRFSSGVTLIVGNAGMREAAAARHIGVDYHAARSTTISARLIVTIRSKGNERKIVARGPIAEELWRRAQQLSHSIPESSATGLHREATDQGVE